MSGEPKILAAGLSDKGLVRRRNEDAFVCIPELGLHAVADGLGGLPGGDIASRVALETLVAEISRISRRATPEWPEVFEKINRAVVEAGDRLSLDGISTTLTVVRINGRTASVAHIGDSGLYLFPELGPVVHLTTDHTMAREMIEKHGPGVADSIPEHFHHTLTRCIGRTDGLPVETRTLKIPAGDRLLLYTDGVTKTQTPAELKRLVRKSETPEACARAIIDTANARGGPDNTTAVAIFGV